jgi:cell fate (sporulation/competence/biofilm development) regulator YmcA (YheA/YmcA/DUF963 family)
MDEILTKAKEIREEVDNLPQVKEYYRLKKLYENDDELKRLRGEIARLASEGKNKQRKALLEIYNSHPLVSNYNQAKEEVIILLNEIKNILD